MSLTETTTMTTTVVYNDDKTHRYLLRKEWDSNLPEAMIIMLSPSTAGVVAVDHTTMFVLSNLERLRFGSVSIVNLFSCLNGRRTEAELDDENLAYITESAERAQTIIYATGTGADGSKAVLRQQRDVLNLLLPWKYKLQCIADARGKKFYHPLCPTVHWWRLVGFEYSELTAFKTSELSKEGISGISTISEAAKPETVDTGNEQPDNAADDVSAESSEFPIQLEIKQDKPKRGRGKK